MKPLRLEMNGFKSFFCPTEIDFEMLADGGIFGIFGNTGAGKSSIVDAIVFALYGENTESLLITDYVNTRRDKATVQFCFLLKENDGRERLFRVVRSIAVDRIKNQLKQSKAEFFETVAGREVTLASGSKDVTVAVERLIGLAIKEFSHCIVLEQNRYDKFVKAKNKERREIVGALFRLNRFGDGLRERLQEKKRVEKEAQDFLKGQLEGLAATKESLAALERTLAESESELIALRGALTHASTETERQKEAAAQYQKKRELKAKRTRAEQELTRAGIVAAKCEAALKGLSGSSEVAQKRCDETILECIRQEAILESSAGIDERILHLSAEATRFQGEAKALHQKKEETEFALRKTNGEIARLEENKQKDIQQFFDLSGVRLPEDPADLDALSDRISETVELFRQQNYAAILSDDLREGDPCPVCGHPFCKKNITCVQDESAEILKALTDRQDNFSKTIRQFRSLSLERDRAVERLKAMDTDLERVEQQAERLVAEREAEQQKRAKLVGNGSVEAAKRSVAQRRADAEKEKKRLETDLTAERDAFQSAVAEEKTARALLDSLRLEEEAIGPIEFDAEAFEKIKSERECLAAAEKDLLVKKARCDTSLSREREDLERRRTIEKDKAVVDKKMALLERIGTMTRAGALMEWLAEEVIGDFTQKASEKLYALSGGEFQLKYEADGFVVVDNFNDGIERKVATVSGGETFLVSLSLAVAIAAKLEESAGARRLEFLFIDEGFGTLSPDKIDAVLDALTELGCDGFTVGFISHVDQMREQIARKLTVRRNDKEEGSVIVCNE